jgi:hypothetical protein
MAIVTMPTDLMIGSCSIGQVRYDMAEVSDTTGAVAVRTYGPPRWQLSIGGCTGMTLAEAAKWEVLVLQLRGRVNTLAAFDPVRVAPAGTLRGSPVLDAPVAAGATSMVLTNAVGTLKRGDWLQVGAGLGTSQVVKVMADAASTVLAPGVGNWVNNVGAAATWVNNVSAAATWSIGGKVTVTFEAPLRYAFGVGSAVQWDRPIGYYKVTTAAPSWSYRAGSAAAQENFALDLLEIFW